MILPRLAYEGLDPRRVAVVGGSALNTAGFPRLAGGYAEGALVADGFFADSDLPAARAFVRRYRERHGVDRARPRRRIRAAAHMLTAALEAGAATRRRPWRRSGRSAKSRRRSALQVLPGGRTARQPFFMTVRGSASSKSA
jgi:ABC-type branched-subunit amino acid transport system substrate-binding protein